MVRVQLTSIFVLIVLANEYRCNEDTLQLVMAVFRHGDRTNDKITLYPTDPYYNYSYYPYGHGQLTNEGKRKMYNLGKKLRKRYNTFLDPIYTNDLLYATSTSIIRAKMSLLMVLAGLFPPLSTGFEWDDHINWTPIPYTYNREITHLQTFAYCKKYQQLYKKYMTSEEVLENVRAYSAWFPYLSFHTGAKLTSLIDIVFIYYHLQIQTEIGMKIPLWSFPVFPEVLKNGTLYFFNTLAGTKELRQLYTGKLIKHLINILQQKVNGTLIPHKRKLFLFSGHDMNVLNTLVSLNADFEHLPPYGACVLIELHKKENQYFVRLFYEDSTSVELKQLNTRGCSRDCPFDKLLELIEEYLTVDDSICNDVVNIEDPFGLE